MSKRRRCTRLAKDMTSPKCKKPKNSRAMVNIRTNSCFFSQYFILNWIFRLGNTATWLKGPLFEEKNCDYLQRGVFNSSKRRFLKLFGGEKITFGECRVGLKSSWLMYISIFQTLQKDNFKNIFRGGITFWECRVYISLTTVQFFFKKRKFQNINQK